MDSIYNSAFIQSAVQFLPLIHPLTHTFTHQRRLAAMQGTNQLVRSNWGLGVLLRDTSTRPGVGSNRQPSRLPDDRSYLLSHIAPNDTFRYNSAPNKSLQGLHPDPGMFLKDDLSLKGHPGCALESALATEGNTLSGFFLTSLIVGSP